MFCWSVISFNLHINITLCTRNSIYNDLVYKFVGLNNNEQYNVRNCNLRHAYRAMTAW